MIYRWEHEGLSVKQPCSLMWEFSGKLCCCCFLQVELMAFLKKELVCLEQEFVFLEKDYDQWLYFNVAKARLEESSRLEMKLFRVWIRCFSVTNEVPFWGNITNPSGVCVWVAFSFIWRRGNQQGISVCPPLDATFQVSANNGRIRALLLQIPNQRYWVNICFSDIWFLDLALLTLPWFASKMLKLHVQHRILPIWRC